jgi:protein-tyrosine phosphatase
MTMIDIHTHLLPGVDDGSQAIADSLPILHAFARGGVETVVCTPHLRASKAATPCFTRYAEIHFDLIRAAGPSAPKLLLGWEIMLDVFGADLADLRLTLGKSTALLVEFPRAGIPDGASEELARLRASGVVPVVAHPERYCDCTIAQVAEWRSAGAAIQLIASALLGGSRAQFAEQLLAEGLVDLLASDTHVDARSLVPARRLLVESGHRLHADLLTRENAHRLLTRQPLVPVPPLRMERTIFQAWARAFANVGARRRHRALAA